MTDDYKVRRTDVMRPADYPFDVTDWPPAPLPDERHIHNTDVDREWCTTCVARGYAARDLRSAAPLPDEELAAIEARDAAWPEGGYDSMLKDEDGLMFAVNDRRFLLAALRAERAAPLDVERLARAMFRVLVPTLDTGDVDIAAPAIADEYARLALGREGAEK